MARGPKKHLKRINAPKHWMLDKMGGNWAPRPRTGPHKLRECLPLILALRNRLKYALNTREVVTICMNKLVSVDGKVRTDHKFPCGFMDVLSLKLNAKESEHFRLLYDTKGRYKLNPITNELSKFKLCKVVNITKATKGVPILTTHDGRTLRYADPTVDVGDTLKLKLEHGLSKRERLATKGNYIESVIKSLKLELGCLIMISKGRNCGRVGVLVHRERHQGGVDIIHVKDEEGNVFATRLVNAFVIGEKEGKSEIELLPRKGVKLSIVEERALWLKTHK